MENNKKEIVIKRDDGFETVIRVNENTSNIELKGREQSLDCFVKKQEVK